MEDVKLIKLAREGYTQPEIAKTLGVSQALVSIKMKKFGILSYQKIKDLIKANPKLSDEEIARYANVNVDAVKRIREEKPKIPDINNPKPNDMKFIELARRGYTQVEIARELKVSRLTISKKMQQYQILPLQSVKNLIKANPKLTDQEIAEQTNIDAESVKRIREKYVENVEFVELARKGYAQEEIAKYLKVSKKTVIRKMKEHKILSPQKVKKLIKANPKLTDEEIAIKANVSIEAVAMLREEIDTHKKEPKEQKNYDKTYNENNFKIKRSELLSRLKDTTNISNMEEQLNVPKKKVEKNTSKTDRKPEDEELSL